MPILPQDIKDIDMVFGGNILSILPKWEDIPDEFKNYHSKQKWNKIVNDWFFKGLPDKTLFICKDGIDQNKALRHLTAIMRSFKPKHEHKTAGCAYLMSLWFDDIVYPAQEKK